MTTKNAADTTTFDDPFFVRFWGVRGSVPSAGASTCQYGGNTSCLEVRCGARTLMLDAGSGAFLFGESLINEESGRIDVLFTHCHYDHIEGAPFFAPVHKKGWQVDYWSGHQYGKMTTADMIKTYMRRPYFPVGPEIFLAQTGFHDFKPGDTLDFGDDITVKTTPLNHPDGAVGYRIEYDGRSICYLTDLEHTSQTPDPDLVAFARGAGIVVYDSTYADEEFDKYVGFGHSTWQQGVRLCDAAGADLFVAFHHQPCHDDVKMDEIARDLMAMRPASIVAREGQILVPKT